MYYWFEKLTKPKGDVDMMVEKLTELEEKIMKAGRTNYYSDILESGGDWVFGVIDASGLDAKIERGAIGSLVKKGLIEVWDNDGEQCMSYTDAGKEIAKDYPTSWRCS